MKIIQFIAWALIIAALVACSGQPPNPDRLAPMAPELPAIKNPPIQLSQSDHRCLLAIRSYQSSLDEPGANPRMLREAMEMACTPPRKQALGPQVR